MWFDFTYYVENKKFNYTEIEDKEVATGKKTTGEKQEIQIRRYTVAEEQDDRDYKFNVQCEYS